MNIHSPSRHLNLMYIVFHFCTQHGLALVPIKAHWTKKMLSSTAVLCCRDIIAYMIVFVAGTIWFSRICIGAVGDCMLDLGSNNIFMSRKPGIKNRGSREILRHS